LAVRPLGDLRLEVGEVGHFGFAQQSSGRSGLPCLTCTQMSCDGI
jgi:hypothetical protein